MFPLAGKSFPTTADELATAIEGALATVLSLKKGGGGVTVDGKAFPAVRKLKVDVSGAQVSATEPPPKPKATGKRQPGLRVGQLEVIGHPVKYENSALHFDLTASDVEFEFGKDKAGKPLLVLTDAAEGKAQAKISKKDVEALLRAVASEAAKQQGVTIQDLELELSSAGKRSVEADVRVKAKKMMVSGVIHIRGRLDIDDELNATVSDLKCDGEGMIGNMIAPVIQSKLKPHEGRQVPLMAFSLGDLALRDLKISTKDPLQVSATFGKA